MDNNNNTNAQGGKSAMRRRDSVAPDLSDTNHMDVHISLLPAQHWSGELNCAPYQTIADAITLGCIRCHVNSSVIAMREEISQQLGDDKKLPSRYIFLKGVGRALVPIRPKQEQMLTVENFRSIGSRLPPEICLLDTVALDKSHSGQTLPESRGSRSNLQKNFKTNDSGIESSTQLKDRVNQNVRDRQKPEKKEVKEVRKPVRSTSQDHKGDNNKTEKSSRKTRETTVDKLKNNELSRINNDGNSRKSGKNVRRSTVKFPPIGQLEEHSDQVTPDGSPQASFSSPRKSKTSGYKSEDSPMARKSSLKNPPKVPIGRRVSVVMTSDQESDESLVLVRSSVSKAHNPRDNQRNSIGRNSIKKSKIPSISKPPPPRSSTHKSNHHQQSELSSEESDQEIIPPKPKTNKSTNSNNNTKPKLSKNSNIASSQKPNQYKVNKTFDSNIYKDSNYKEPKITKNKKSSSNKSSKHIDGTSSEPHRVESYEEFYRRKSVNLTDVEDLAGLQCPDCGQIFKTTMDSKRHFNLIHRTSKKQIEAKKKILALKNKVNRNSRWGAGNVNVGLKN